MDKLLERLIREDVEFVFVPGQPLGSIKADPGQIEQVLLNLTVNACDAMPSGGKITVETSNVTVDEGFSRSHPGLAEGSYVSLTVTDSGHGMDAATKARIFEPFFTTKDVGKGTGLGLSTVYGIVKQSGGFIWVDSATGKGTCFRVYLPKINEQIDRSDANSSALPAVHGSPTILVVEDDVAVRELAVRFLTSAGYRVRAANDGVEALAIAKHCMEPISAVLTDIVMPNMRDGIFARIHVGAAREKVPRQLVDLGSPCIHVFLSKRLADQTGVAVKAGPQGLSGRFHAAFKAVFSCAKFGEDQAAQVANFLFERESSVEWQLYVVRARQVP